MDDKMHIKKKTKSKTSGSAIALVIVWLQGTFYVYSLDPTSILCAVLDLGEKQKSVFSSCFL